MLPHHLGLGAGAHLLLDLQPDVLQLEVHFLQDIHRDALAQLDEPEQEVLGAHVVVVEAISFLAGEREDLLGAGSEVVHHCGR